MKAIVNHSSVLRGAKMRVAVVISRYHEEITNQLLEGAKQALEKAGIAHFDVYWVSGAFELPQATELVAETGSYDAVIPLGCLIRGETSHFDAIARTTAIGLDAVGRAFGVAVSFGVLTVDSIEQAKERSGGKWGNKGEEAALAAMDLAQLREELQNHGKSKKSARTSSSDSVSHRPR